MNISKTNLNFIKGILLTLFIALIAALLSNVPGFSIMGQLVIAIILGIVWRMIFGFKEAYNRGITFSNKKLLRLGIIFLGMSLNILHLYEAGINVFLFALLNLVFALIVVYFIAKWLGVGRNLSILTACGTAICGASAIVAIAPQIRANSNEIAISAATIAMLGTIFTLGYTLVFPLMNLTEIGYGIFAGGTLHEVAHAVAAAGTGGSAAVDMAVIVKLSRVALLVPVAIVIGLIVLRSERKNGEKVSSVAIPWFILGFVIMSGINTLGIVPQQMADWIVNFAYLFIAMAMAGLGLNVDIHQFRKLGKKPFIAGLIGTVLLVIFGYSLIHVFQLNI